MKPRCQAVTVEPTLTDRRGPRGQCLCFASRNIWGFMVCHHHAKAIERGSSVTVLRDNGFTMTFPREKP